MLKKLAPLIAAVKKDKDILAVMLFGSAARKEKHRDIDVALVLYPKKQSSLEMSNILLRYVGISDAIDVSVFQQLPLYIQKRVLKEGKLLFTKDEDALYDVVFDSIRATEDFMPRYRMFLEVEVSQKRFLKNLEK